MGCGEDTPEPERSQNASAALHYTLHLVTEYLFRFYPAMDGMPGASSRLLHKDVANHGEDTAREMLRQWYMLHRLEALAAKMWQPALRVLACMPQRKQSVLRLLYTFLEFEREQPLEPGVVIGPITRHILQPPHTRFPDEKIVEDVNSFVRDTARKRRGKRVPMVSVFNKISSRECCNLAGTTPPA